MELELEPELLSRTPGGRILALGNQALARGAIEEVDALAVAIEAGGAATCNAVLLGALSSVDTFPFPLSYESIAKAIESTGKAAYLSIHLSLAKGARR